MKKLIAIFVAVLGVFCFAFTGCDKKSPDLSVHLVELRTNIYVGENDGLKLTCAYGFNKDIDGEYRLTFKLKTSADTPVTYTLNFKHDKSYTEEFKLNPVSHALTTQIQVDNFTKDTFTVTVYYGGESKEITLTSIRPSNTLDYKTALNSLYKSQPSLLQNYTNGGAFTGKVRMRLTVKNGKSYYFVSFENGEGQVKALLLDGKNATVLAVREIF